MSVQWNFELDFKSSLKKGARLDRKRFSAEPYHQFFNTKDVCWSAFERWAVEAARRAFKQLFENFGYDQVEIGDDRIHIMTTAQYNKQVHDPDRDDAGKHISGHIYIQRRRCRWRFLQDLTHEMSHQSAFYRLAVRRSLKQGKVFCHVGVAQSGLIHNSLDSRPVRYEGFGEAVTEMFAKSVRHIICRGKHLLSAREISQLKRMTAYYLAVHINERLIAACATKRRPEIVLYQQLFRDHIEGSYTMLRVFNRKFPGVSRILREMRPTPEAMIAATKQIFGAK